MEPKNCHFSIIFVTELFLTLSFMGEPSGKGGNTQKLTRSSKTNFSILFI